MNKVYLNVKNYVQNVLLILLVMFCLTACEDKSTKAEISQIFVSPDSLSFDEENISSTITLTSDSSREVEWEITSKAQWIEVDYDSGSLANEEVILDFRAIPYTLWPGTYQDSVKFSSASGSECKVDLYLEVREKHPYGVLTIDSLLMANLVEDCSFKLKNLGTDSLFWNLHKTEEWLEISPTSGVLARNKYTLIRVSVDKHNMDPAIHQGEILITSNSSSGNITLPYLIEIPEIPILELDQTKIRFMYDEDVDSLRIINQGNCPLEWRAIIDGSFVTLTGDSGSINAKDSVCVGIEIDRSDLSTGVHSGEIAFTNGENEIGSVQIEVFNYAESNGNRFLDFDIVDARFSRQLNKIIALSNIPNHGLYIIDPVSGDDQYVNLSYESSCLSLSPNGLYAIVGHDYIASYVNLQSICVESVYLISGKAGDIVLDNNGFFHVFPTQAQWTHVSSVELATGNEQIDTSLIYSGCKGRLHPSGNYIYASNDAISPGNIYKFNISNGYADYLYDFPYTIPNLVPRYFPNLWLAHDGTKAYSGNGEIFTTTDLQESDMLNQGDFSGIDRIAWLDDNPNSSDLYLIETGPYLAETEVKIYDSNNYTYIRGYSLPILQFLNNGSFQNRQAKGKYVFSNDSANSLFCLATIPNSSYWLLLSFDN